MNYEIINPSDKCFIASSDREAACAAVLILGDGMYALRDETGAPVMPILAFGGADEWWIETFGHRLPDYLETAPHAAIADVLATFTYERKSTSVNDIAGRALSYYKHFRQLAQGKSGARDDG